jgi:hypothetical protein
MTDGWTRGNPAPPMQHRYFGRVVTLPIAVGTLLVFGSIIWRALASDGHGPGATTVKAASLHASNCVATARYDAGRVDDVVGD